MKDATQKVESSCNFDNTILIDTKMRRVGIYNISKRFKTSVQRETIERRGLIKFAQEQSFYLMIGKSKKHKTLVAE